MKAYRVQFFNTRSYYAQFGSESPDVTVYVDANSMKEAQKKARHVAEEATDLDPHYLKHIKTSYR